MAQAGSALSPPASTSQGCQGTLRSPLPRALQDPSLSTRVPAAPSPARVGPARWAAQVRRTAARAPLLHLPRSQPPNQRTARCPPSDCSGPGPRLRSGWGGAEWRPSSPRSCPLPLGSGSAGHPPCRNPPSGRTRRATRASARVRLGGGLLPSPPRCYLLPPGSNSAGHPPPPPAWGHGRAVHPSTKSRVPGLRQGRFLSFTTAYWTLNLGVYHKCPP